MLKTTKFWLIVSLCLNLVFLGFFVGGMVQARNVSSNADAPPPNELSAFMRAMPADRRKAWIGHIRGNGSATRPNLDNLASLIAADPFNPDAVSAYFAKNRAANDARVESAQNAMLQSLMQMSQAEREAIALRIRELPKHHPNASKNRPGKKDQKSSSPQQN